MVDNCKEYNYHNMHFESNSISEVKRKIADTELLFLTYQNIENIQKLLTEALNVGDCSCCA